MYNDEVGMVYYLAVEGMTFDISTVVVGERKEVLVLLQQPR